MVVSRGIAFVGSVSLVLALTACVERSSDAGHARKSAANLVIRDSGSCKVELTKVDYDQPGNDTGDFLELLVTRSGSSPPATLLECGIQSIALFDDGDCVLPYGVVLVTGVAIPADGRIVIAPGQPGININFVDQTEGWLRNDHAELAFLAVTLGNPALSHVSWGGAAACTAPVTPAPQMRVNDEGNLAPNLVNVWCTDRFVLQDASVAGPGMAIDCGGTGGAGGGGGSAGAAAGAAGAAAGAGGGGGSAGAAGGAAGASGVAGRGGVGGAAGSAGAGGRGGAGASSGAGAGASGASGRAGAGGSATGGSGGTAAGGTAGSSAGGTAGSTSSTGGAETGGSNSGAGEGGNGGEDATGGTSAAGGSSSSGGSNVGGASATGGSDDGGAGDGERDVTVQGGGCSVGPPARTERGLFGMLVFALAAVRLGRRASPRREVTKRRMTR